MEKLEQMPESRWLSVDEISAYLGVKRDTVYNWISEKSMPAHRMGRLWKFRRDEVDDWIKKGGPAKWAAAPGRRIGHQLPGPDYDENVMKQRMNGIMLNEQDKRILEKLKGLLQREVKLHQLILFGSRARGNAASDSDMDVLVIVDEPVTQQLRDRVSRCAWQAGFDEGIVVASVLYTHEEWENGPERFSPFAETVRSEGILL